MHTGIFWVQHIQYMPSSATTDDEREASKHHSHSRNNTDSSLHGDPSSSLEKESNWTLTRMLHWASSNQYWLIPLQLDTQEWWLHQRRTDHQDVQWTYRISMMSPWGICTILHSLFNQISMVPAHMQKTMLDVWNGYYNLLLSPLCGMLLYSLPNGADTDTSRLHRVSMLTETPILVGLTMPLLIWYEKLTV